MKTRFYEVPTTKTLFYKDFETVDKYVKAYDKISRYIVDNSPIFKEEDENGFGITEPVLFEDFIYAILEQQSETAKIQIILNEHAETSVTLEIENKPEKIDYIVSAIYNFLECGKRVTVDGKDIRNIYFEY